MLKREKWLYLIASILLIWNLTYLIVINVVPLPQKISWNGIFILASDKISSIRVLLFSLLSLVFSFIGIFINLFLNYKKHHSQTNKYSLGLTISLSFTIIIPFVLTFNSQMALANYYDNIKTSSYDKAVNLIWLNSLSIWIIGTVFLIASVVALLIYTMNYNSLFKYSFNREKSLADLKEIAFNSTTNKIDFEPATGYLPNNSFNKYVSTSTNYIPNLSATININDIDNPSDYLQDQNEENIGLYHYEKTQIIENNSIDDLSLLQSTPPMNIQTSSGFTQQIKNEYERDFMLVQELHRINMAQSNARIAKLINIFYNRYEQGLDLDVDRVMLLIYRVAIDYEPLYGYLKDAVLYKLDSKFISDLARNWFKNYSNKINNFYSTNRHAFKKSIDEGIKIMDNDIEKYLQDSNFKK